MKRILSILLTMILCLCAFAPALADGTPPSPPSGGMAPPSGGPGGGPGGMGGPGGPGMQESDVAGTGTSVNTTGLITVSSSEVTGAAELGATVSGEDDQISIAGLNYTGEDYSTTLVNVSDSDTVLDQARITLDVMKAISGTENAGAALYADSGVTQIQNSEITVNGAGRYTVVATGSAVLAVSNSVITAGGDNGADGLTASVSEPASNKGLLISGTSRANFSVGQSHTFYYDSLCVADGWAALSTDSATGSGLEFVAVDTEALALHGGYGIYSDTNCRDYLYGTALISAEIGGIISNNGSIQMNSSSAAALETTQDGNSPLLYSDETENAEDLRSLVVAGRNDFQLHSPDMMGEGTSDYTATLRLTHTDLITDASMNEAGYSYTSSVNGETYLLTADTDYAEKYGDAIGAYVDYVSGAAILVKSTSAEISLEDVTVSSCNGVALLSALNSDSMSRYLKKDVGSGVSVNITDSIIDGGILHDDYQRDMAISLSDSTLNGDIHYSDYDAWNAKWEAVSEDESCCWYQLDSSVYVTDTHATDLSLTNGSVWNVQGASELTLLRVSPDSTVNGTIQAESTETLADGTIVYTGVTVTADSAE